jgi:ribosome-associated protein
MPADPASPDPASPEPEPLRLDHFLKLVGAVGSGGQAKQLIQNGEVLLNGEIETRRRKKLTAGDKVTVEGQTFTVDPK